MQKDHLKIVKLAIGIVAGIFAFSTGVLASAGPYTISMDGWKAKPGCKHGSSVVSGYVSGLTTPINQPPTSMTLVIPAKMIRSLQEAVTPYTGQSIWNGIDFAIKSGPNQILQPVLWKGDNFSIPSKNALPNYVWVYDNDKQTFTKSTSWAKKNLKTYYDYAILKKPMILHYYSVENGIWKMVSSGKIDEFQNQLSQNKGQLFVNSQYVEFIGSYYLNGKNAEYDQVSKDIIAVPQGVNASVKLQITVPSDGSNVTITSSVNIPNVDSDNAPKSILKVTQLHNPPQNQVWGENVYNMTPAGNIDLWNNRANSVYPVTIEAGVGDYQGNDPAHCAISTINAWNGQEILLDQAPDTLPQSSQVDSSNPITPG